MHSIEQLRAYYGATVPYDELALEDRGDLVFWRSIAARWSPQRILELGCGTGRVTSVLTAHASTIAVDLLIEMVQRARPHAPSARYLVADLREIAFAGAFDLVVLANDPMAHLTGPEERRNALQRIADHLAPEGRLVLEGLYVSSGRPKRAAAREISRDGKRLFTVEECWEPAGREALWKVTYRYARASETTDATSVLRSWTTDEVRRLPEAGLEVEALWGDFDERPFSDTAPRIVMVAKRSRR